MARSTAPITDLLRQHRPGHALQQPFYNAPDIYEADLEAIFYREWLYAFPACQLDKTGAYQRLRIGAYDVIVIRDGKGQIVAYHNSCRHRGSSQYRGVLSISSRFVTSPSRHLY